MIETTEDTIDGITFYKDIKILEPDDTIGGLPVHRISDRVIMRDDELMRAIKALGLKRVGRDIRHWGGCELYAQFPSPFIPIKVIQFTLRVYWAVIRWLYDNARVFKQIPVGECFSWRYFTPYVWYKKIRG